MNQKSGRSRENSDIVPRRVDVVQGLNLASAQHSAIVASVVAYANGEQSSVGHGRTVPLFMLKPDPSRPGEYPGLDEAITQLRNSERDFAVQMLQAAAAGLESLNAFIVDAIRVGRCTLARIGGKLLLIGGTPTLESLDVRGNPEEWVMHAAVTLASSSHSNQTDIGRCQLPTCARFFVIQRGKVGAPARRYCCDEHRQEQHDAGAAKRQRDSRENRIKRSRATARRRR